MSLIGADTVAVERFTRRPDVVTGEVVVRSPSIQRTEYSVSLSPNGSMERFELKRSSGLAQDAPVTARFSASARGDSVALRSQRADSTETRMLSAPSGTMLDFQYSTGLEETAIVRSRSAASEFPVRVRFVGLGGQSFESVVRRFGADSAHLITEADTMRGRIGADGRYVSFGDRSTPPSGASFSRVSWDAASAVIEDWARRPNNGALGPLSGRDTVRASVGGGQLSIDYGRPARRGRVIFGGIVPWDVVWRAGAGSATSLTTSIDLTIGGTPVPAGTYTLYALPSRSGWKLIINKRPPPDADYHAEDDLARIDMSTEVLAAPVDRFTVGVEPRGGDAVLVLEWDTTRASVPIVARR